MERFENAIFKHREVINDRMTEMFGLLKELSNSRTLKEGNRVEPSKSEEKEPTKKAFVTNEVERRETITLKSGKNKISFHKIPESHRMIEKGIKNEIEPVAPMMTVSRGVGCRCKITLMEIEMDGIYLGSKFWVNLEWNEEEKDIVIDGAIAESIVEPSKSNEEEPLKEVYVTTKLEKGRKLTNEIPTEIDIRLSLASHSYIYPLGIAKYLLVDVAGYVYPMDFVILDIKEDEKSPIILGTPFLTTAKVVIKFDKGMITLKSRKSKINFHEIPESQCMIKKGIKNDIGPIAPIMTVNRLALEWEEKIKLHQEKEMKFDQ
uniref:Reverse transcriptase domain-containing protein n=1 Tax=Tanacetum cinerariifolium TaxID=118510 RepID=A0A6L2JKC4_TANCI|nr:hypothetical protein [Tanacetum cinerariifolium]